MFTALHLGNFKAFADTQEAPLRPLTLLYGPNSAGKSSLIHSLALAHHGLLTGDLDVQRTEIGGESIDLGGFRQYVHRRDATRRVEWGLDLSTTGAKDQLAELLAPVNSVSLRLSIGLGFIGDQQTLFGELAREQGRVVGVESCALLADGKPLLSMSARRDGRMRIDRLDQEHAVFQRFVRGLIESATYYQKVGDTEIGAAEAAIDDLLPNFDVQRRGLLPRVQLRGSAQEDLAQALISPAASGNRQEDVRRTVQLAAPRMLRDLINGISDAAASALQKFHYLGPLRSYPPRHLAFSPHHDPNWHAGGGAAWDVLRRDNEVRAAVNQWLNSAERLSTPYEVVVRELLAFDQFDGPLSDALEAFEERITGEQDGTGGFGSGDGDGHGYGDGSGYGSGRADGSGYGDGREVIIKDLEEEVERFKGALLNSDVDRFSEIVLTDRRSNTVVSHRDVGIGVSQVLPVLVNAYGRRQKTVAIEQPEIHLHPALQSELADVFIESALGERANTFLLETHSEHLMLRILRRVRETTEKTLPAGAMPIRPEDVMVLYVEPEGPSSKIVELPVTPDGEFARPWPRGFFAERMQELV